MSSVGEPASVDELVAAARAYVASFGREDDLVGVVHRWSFPGWQAVARKQGVAGYVLLDHARAAVRRITEEGV